MDTSSWIENSQLTKKKLFCSPCNKAIPVPVYFSLKINRMRIDGSIPTKMTHRIGAQCTFQGAWRRNCTPIDLALDSIGIHTARGGD
jgi:hypothetical protein